MIRMFFVIIRNCFWVMASDMQGGSSSVCQASSSAVTLPDSTREDCTQMQLLLRQRSQRLELLERLLAAATQPLEFLQLVPCICCKCFGSGGVSHTTHTRKRASASGRSSKHTPGIRSSHKIAGIIKSHVKLYGVHERAPEDAPLLVDVLYVKVVIDGKHVTRSFAVDVVVSRAL